jgi:drug/metabolite transporter (DMT)-like permease
LSPEKTASIEFADPRTRSRRSVLLVSLCTIVGAAAQVFIKLGANALPHPSLWQMVTSTLLLAGYSLYGLSTVLMVLALREGELSLLYPIISLTYVWVAILSVVVFREPMNGPKIIGVALIIIGVAVLGKNGKK